MTATGETCIWIFMVLLWNPLRIVGFLEKALCDILQVFQLPGGPMDLPALGLEKTLGGGYQPWSPSWLAASPLDLALIGDHPWLSLAPTLRHSGPTANRGPCRSTGLSSQSLTQQRNIHFLSLTFSRPRRRTSSSCLCI